MRRSPLRRKPRLAPFWCNWAVERTRIDIDKLRRDIIYAEEPA